MDRSHDVHASSGILDLGHSSGAATASVAARVLDTEPTVDASVPSTWADGFHFELLASDPLSLSTLLPVLGQFGVEVLEEHPSRDRDRYRYLLRVRHPQWTGSAAQRDALQDAFVAVWANRAESDGFNALVLGGGLSWRQVVVLRATAAYLRQTGSRFSPGYVESALASNPTLAAALVALFEERFDPDRPGGAARHSAEAAVRARILDGLDEVGSLDHDRIIRALLGVITATVRTNFYRTDDDQAVPAVVAFKLDPSGMPDLPAPRPWAEIWVHAPRVEGVHLRFGPIARGGLRWSDRREDFRTEVLGLVKAQMVKNAVIVPTGAKGGFYPKQLPASTDREAWLSEGLAAYQMFVSGLLEVTDNRIDGVVVPPLRVVRHDGDDPYLVVAADKGTASFSDAANELARRYAFWLDDAFASGGSVGYDHKAMGITARGAWESVERHFRELGIDTRTEEFTAIGVGDMSGDVFGNGMLLSPHLRLVAAFDHRHIFIDPDPVAATSFLERKRLFALPRSTWADYDRTVISPGGGVYDRTLKAVPVSPHAAQALGLPAGTESRNPAELIAAILRAPVDLLWNGGIGTYVKSRAERDSDVGDRANDAVRVDGADLRVKVVGEGGNLGLTQLGRIEAAHHGVRVNTDAVDNSAGVDTSDHEVNIKILLSVPVREGRLSRADRDTLLAAATEDVAAAVLRDNYEQNVLLGNARAQEHLMLRVHQRLVRWLEERGTLDRALEQLPTDVEIDRRDRAGQGLTSPEFAVLVAHVKLALKAGVLASGLPDDPWFATTLVQYFPPAMRERCATDIDAHPLRREIITNSVVNSLVNRGGLTFAFRAGEETGATVEQIARAFVVCREVFDLSTFVGEVEALDGRVSTAAQSQLYLEFRGLIDRAVRWFLHNRPVHLDVGAEVARFRDVMRQFEPDLPGMLTSNVRRTSRIAELRELGLPANVAARAAGLLDRFALLDSVEIALATGRPPAEVVPVHFAVSERFAIGPLLSQAGALPADEEWDALARTALRDDLYAVLEALTTAVLAGTDAGASAAVRIDAWRTAHAGSLRQAEQTLARVRGLDHPNPAQIAAGLRAWHGVLRRAAAGI
jgi:glutamate dehydrogenase